MGNKTVVPLTSLNEASLEVALERVTSQEVVEAAARLGEIVREEPNGIMAAAEVLIAHWDSHKRPLRPDGSPIVVEWMQDKDVSNCSISSCGAKFTLVRRKHHCRSCGAIVCANCCSKISLPLYADDQRVCQPCEAMRSSSGVTTKAAADDIEATAITDTALLGDKPSVASVVNDTLQAQ